MKPMLITVTAALQQFKDQATDQLLLFALEGKEDLGTTQKEDTKKDQPKC